MASTASCGKDGEFCRETLDDEALAALAKDPPGSQVHWPAQCPIDNLSQLCNIALFERQT